MEPVTLKTAHTPTYLGESSHVQCCTLSLSLTGTDNVRQTKQREKLLLMCVRERVYSASSKTS